jgi:hypothetical protein
MPRTLSLAGIVQLPHTPLLVTANNTKKILKILELDSGKQLRQDICSHYFRSAVLHFKKASIFEVPNVVEAVLDMFASVVLSWLLRRRDSGSVVTPSWRVNYHLSASHRPRSHMMSRAPMATYSDSIVLWAFSPRFLDP